MSKITGGRFQRQGRRRRGRHELLTQMDSTRREPPT